MRSCKLYCIGRRLFLNPTPKRQPLRIEGPAFSKALLGIDGLLHVLYCTRQGIWCGLRMMVRWCMLGGRTGQVKIRGQIVEATEIEHGIADSGRYGADGVAVEVGMGGNK